MFRIIDQDPTTDDSTNELVQEFQYQQASLTVENEKMVAWRKETASRRQLIDEALIRLKTRLEGNEDEDNAISFPISRRKAK